MHDFEGRVDKQAWMRGSSIGPDDIGEIATIPGSDFGKDASILFGERDVCRDGVETLRTWRFGCGMASLDWWET